MTKRWALTILFCAALATPSLGQNKFEVFGGYSYAHGSESLTSTQLCPGPLCPTQTLTPSTNLNGWEGSFVYNPLKGLGIVADFSGHYGTVSPGSGASSVHLNTFMFGPQFSINSPKISPFVHFLFGGAHQSIGPGGSSGSYIVPSNSSNGFATAVGGGVDIKVSPLLYLRPIQADLFSAPTHSLGPRISAGLALHF